MTDKEQVLKKALKMTPVEKADIIEQLIESLDRPDEDIDKLWKKEVDDRIDAFDRGNIKGIALHEVLEKYKKE